MASPEIIEESDATVPPAEGWKIYYKVRRSDGEEVSVDANCTRSAEAFAQNVKHPETMEFIGDRGRSATLRYAERAQSPAQRGTVLVRLWVDPLNGQLRSDIDYERPTRGPRSCSARYGQIAHAR